MDKENKQEQNRNRNEIQQKGIEMKNGIRPQDRNGQGK